MTLRFASLAAVAALLIAAPAASAATATVTNDGGSPVPADGATIRNMSPEVALQFAPEEKRYGVTVTGPGGAAASAGTDCLRTSSPLAERVRYQGNGTYTVLVRTSKVEDDYDCAQATEQRFTFTINAFTGVVAPGALLLTRPAGSFATIGHPFRIDVNPGADAHEIRYAAGAVIGPDGAISGPSESAFLDTSTGAAVIRFPRPGTYTVVARAKDYGSAGETPTPWSAPVIVTVLAPFDLVSVSFPDARGPSYRLRGQIRETTATGKVTIAIAKGKKSRRFRRLGSAKIRRGGVFQLRFKLRKTGTYRLRYTYRGGPTTAPGGALEQIRITRRVFFK